MTAGGGAIRDLDWRPKMLTHKGSRLQPSNPG